jgi:hypothetical protein
LEWSLSPAPLLVANTETLHHTKHTADSYGEQMFMHMCVIKKDGGWGDEIGLWHTSLSSFSSLNFNTVCYRINLFFFILCCQQITLQSSKPFLKPSIYIYIP